MAGPIAVDPWDCGCTECITGEYVALRFATDDNIADLLAGRVRNNLGTGTRLVVALTYETRDGRLVVDRVEVRYTHGDGLQMTWNPDPYRAGLAA